jgi:hypothetical protein
MGKPFISHMAKIVMQPHKVVTLRHSENQGPSLEGRLSRNQPTTSVNKTGKLAIGNNKTYETTLTYKT